MWWVTKHSVEIPQYTCYVSKGSYTLCFTQQKNFQSCTCLVFPWPISSHTVYFWQLFRIFCICLSCPSGVPVTSPLFLAAFEHVLHLYVFITSSALPVTRRLYTAPFLQKLQCDPALSCSKAGHWLSTITYLPTFTACIQIVHQQILVHEKIRGQPRGMHQRLLAYGVGGG